MGLFNFGKSPEEKQAAKEEREVKKAEKLRLENEKRQAALQAQAQREAEQRAAVEQYQTMLRQIKSGQGMPDIEPGPLVLQKGEVCHYAAQAHLQLKKTVSAGYSGGSTGVSVRVAKGVTLRTGSGKGKAIKREVVEKYPGVALVTNKRVVFVADNQGFSLPYNKLLSRNHYRDGYSLITDKKAYTLIMPEHELFDAFLTGALTNFSH